MSETNSKSLLQRAKQFGFSDRQIASLVGATEDEVRALRKKLNLTQEQFATRFHLPLGTVRDWEQGAHRPDKAAQVLLTVIAKDPDAVARALES